MTFRMRYLIVALAVISTSLAVSAPVSAGNWYGATGNVTCGGNMQDNRDMTYHRDSGLPSAFNSAAAYALNNAVLPTDINLKAEQSSPNSNTDVVIQEANYTGTWCGFTWHGGGGSVIVGYASCESLSGSKCQSFNTYTDQSWEVSQTTTGRRNHACHELGHTLGLAHPDSTEDRTNSCLYSTTKLGYSNHDIDVHINVEY